MGELNLDKFERVFNKTLEHMPNQPVESFEQETVSGCHLAVRDCVPGLDHECRYSERPALVRYLKLHRHFTVA